MSKYIRQLEKEHWYHGTTLEGWKQLCEKKIKVDYNKGNELDFGFGFYLTQRKEQAETYTNNIIKFRKQERSNFGDFADFGFDSSGVQEDEIAVVIEFNIAPLEWFKNEQYNFGIFDSYDDRFAEFVFHNRVNNINGELHHNYDLIYGVMSDSLPMILVSNYQKGEIGKDDVLAGLKKTTRDTQLSIHNQAICDKMMVHKAYLVETGEELNVDEYNYTK